MYVPPAIYMLLQRVKYTIYAVIYMACLYLSNIECIYIFEVA